MPTAVVISGAAKAISRREVNPANTATGIHQIAAARTAHGDTVRKRWHGTLCHQHRAERIHLTRLTEPASETVAVTTAT